MDKVYRISGFADELSPQLEEQIKGFQELGITGIELRGVDGKGVQEHSLAEMRTIKERLDQAGLHVSAVGSPIGKIDIEDEFGPHFELFRHVVEIAKILETRYIRMFSFYIPAGENADQYQTEVMKRLRQLADYAKRHQMVLLHENEKGIYGDMAGRCLNIFRELGSEHFRCTFDFANFVECGQDTLEAYQMLKPYISYIHIKDADAGKNVVPAGYGSGNLKEILCDLYQNGYDGYLSLEPHLTNFQGLQSLEQGAKERVGKLSQKEAFVLAHSSLMKILDEL